MKLPPLIGVALKFDTLTVWAMHLGPETTSEWSGPGLNATKAAKHASRTVLFSVFNISLPVMSRLLTSSMKAGQKVQQDCPFTAKDVANSHRALSRRLTMGRSPSVRRPDCGHQSADWLRLTAAERKGGVAQFFAVFQLDCNQKSAQRFQALPSCRSLGFCCTYTFTSGNFSCLLLRTGIATFTIARDIFNRKQNKRVYFYPTGRA
jgi:hypothetical protein